MIICGIKLTHDSSITIIDNNELIFCIELEKISNNNRFKIIDSIEEIPLILRKHGYSLSSIDKIVIDGWVGEETSRINVMSEGKEISIPVAPYHEVDLSEDILKKHTFSNLILEKKSYSYESYTHVASHILGAYGTSPFASQKKNSYILVWDGGMYPRLYYYDSNIDKFKALGPIFYIGANCYSIFAQHFGPFKINSNVIKDELSIAGKVMAYCAFGKIDECIVNDLDQAYLSTIDKAKDISFLPQYPYLLAKRFIEITSKKTYSEEDILTSFHYFLQKKLLIGLKNFVDCSDSKEPLCYSGGAALNIKWNSAIRNSNLFSEVWVPPFPNDSGNSIGAAICSLANSSSKKGIKWNVYRGPDIIVNELPEGWYSTTANIESIASILYNDEPIIVLNDKAELGPRSLGNRSILASPLSNKMKGKLNEVKFREHYRPVAPVCIENMAQEIFEPGTPDPYMLFEHSVREKWKNKIPAISHYDNTARLQTINEDSNSKLYQLLKSFEQLSGVPVLCNTSANLKGRGFFPDIFSAAKWGRINYIWCNKQFYYRK